MTPETINISDIIIGDRARKDLGDVDSMAASIKEYGLIQPIVVNRLLDVQDITLVVGGRCLAALKKLGLTELKHGVEFIWRYETDDLRMKSIELEENLKRKDMTWDEVLAAKAKLLEIMQSIHGVQNPGASRLERASGSTSGFGVVKLAAMLGESPATVSSDLQLASMLKVMPHLKQCENKSAAMRQGVLTAVVGMVRQKEAVRVEEQKQAIAAGTITEAEAPKDWTLYEGDFRDNIQYMADASVDLVFTDLPYGVGIENHQSLPTGISFKDKQFNILQLLPEIAKESFRVLKDARYAVFWFGFNFYTELKTELEKVGFQVNPRPFIWLKNRSFNHVPLRWYTSRYEQALICCKGNANFVKPGQVDVLELVQDTTAQKIHATQKPIELCEKFILDMTLPHSTVVDLFAGSGLTGIAAIKNNRKVVLFEKDTNLCSLIRNRLSTSQKV